MPSSAQALFYAIAVHPTASRLAILSDPFARLNAGFTPTAALVLSGCRTLLATDAPLSATRFNSAGLARFAGTRLVAPTIRFGLCTDTQSSNHQRCECDSRS